MATSKWVMDYETLSTCFVGVFIEATSLERRIFVMSRLSNDFDKFMLFLEEHRDNLDWHISFNGHAFDAQITEFFLNEAPNLVGKSGLEIAEFAYSKSQQVINLSRAKEFLPFSIYNFRIKQLDIFKLKHWNNPAKKSSLKWIQYSMDWPKLLDMPIHHTTDITTQLEQDTIVHYCINDVMSTREIFLKSIKEVQLRGTLSRDYELNLYSASEPGIAKEIFLKLLAQESGEKIYNLRKLRTFRSIINVEEALLPSIKFNTAPFQILLNKYKEQRINPENTKGGFKYTVRYKGLPIEYGLGGVHGALKASIIESDNEVVIMSADVSILRLNPMNCWKPYY
jgi:hypothetical protein